MNLEIVIMGIVIVIVGFLCFKFPEKMAKFPKARMWIEIMGEEKTVKFIKYGSASILLIGGIAFIIFGFLNP